MAYEAGSWVLAAVVVVALVGVMALVVVMAEEEMATVAVGKAPVVA